ncbi:flagellar basal-body rod protein FlgC [Thermanaeromonas toyohensis ToBE]|uniref:Flagellar basal-body rod protein FlgC n=1 Tax=Thermanaeromonas toyohensis ToBE TaxID=698762 RepID=A0A1W1VTA4_9FIRM|nr:flagellar basal body rod protein FlgC [Thermanaeromonas toyohensis]SMB96556.1 flagellar basal-body rod protein FlgC [Thermanaeromonas toyohensis ToBE]
MLLQSFNISTSALTAERLRMDIVAENLANAETTRTPEGGPYRRKVPVFVPLTDGGVGVAAVVEDPSPPRLKFDPGHPDAGPDGYVRMPNIDVAREMVDLAAASRAYEASVAVLTVTRAMALRALDISSR